MSWNNITVGDLVERGEAEVKTGPFGTQLRASDYAEKGTPVINVRNIGFGNIRHDKLEYIPDDVVTRLSGHLLRKGDIVFGRKGAVERHVYITGAQNRWFQGSDCLRLRILSEENVLSKYLSFTFLTHEHQSWMMQQCSHGATMASLNQDIIKRIPLRIPSIEQQKIIVDILSSYDDLIENNTRRIEILEEMARRLYEEWFVHFRFPGHEEVSFKESELGEIPEGWEVATVGDFVNIKRGKTITKKKIEPGNVPVVAGGLRPAYYHSTANTKGPLLTISASGANAGHVSLYYDDVWASDCSFIDSSESQHVYYYYLMLKVRQEEVTHLQRGSAQPHVYPKDVMGLQAVNAPLSLRESFMNHVGPMFRAIDTLLKKNVNLRAQRDLLLPKLVSGEIDVSDMPMPEDKEVEAA
jgi:type I restriction enzyme S subunit